MSETIFGGNRVVSLGTPVPVAQLADGVYRYRMVSLAPGASHVVDDMASYTIFCLSATPAGLSVGGDVLHVGDSVRVEKTALTLTAGTAASVVLVAGVRSNPQQPAPSVVVTRSADQYRVSKPWGHELWLNGEHPAYVLKEVFIKAGNRTSLQYHRFKEETNLLIAGTATLVYKAPENISNDEVQPEHLGTTDLQAPSFVHIVAPALHRLIAKTDVMLYEASTPHLDDVIRVQDDSQRKDGRIQKEHGR